LPSNSENAKEAIIRPVDHEHGDLKRRKLSDASMERIQAEPEERKSVTKSQVIASSSSQKPAEIRTQDKTTPKTLSSLARKISSPLTSQGHKPSAAAPKQSANRTSVPAKKTPGKIEVLNPRLVPSNNTPYALRSSLLKLIHAEFVRLNSEVRKSTEEKISSLKLTDNDLVRMVLDQEEEIARKQAGLYKSMMTGKLSHYKKMSLNDWVKERQKEEAVTKGATTRYQTSSDALLKIETGLSHSEELHLLERFVLSPNLMSQAGFILTPPSDAQIADARKTVEASGGYETCDRCGTRFQVLAEPKEDGSHTTNGKCTHHWGKLVFPKREKTDSITGPREALYICCNQPKGSPGCSKTDSHVFKISTSNVGRLADILQFQATPPNSKADRIAIAFDCEMGYTTAGLEMIRISACKWPSNEALIDVLVKPVGKVLDLNTKFSGVTPHQFYEAIEFDAEQHTPLPEPADSDDGDDDDATKPTTGAQKLKIVSSPAAARSLLTKYISPNTVLIGHAIDNDLNVLRLLHPTIVDTSLLFPHHGGLPYRYPLRRLAKDFLNLDIQTAGAEGHDSMEDSRATGDLVRHKIMMEWQKLKSQGWSVKEGKWYAMVGGKERVATLPPYTESMGWSKKRKAEQEKPASGQVGETMGLKELLREKSEGTKL
jgi:hypothetical protein